MESLSRIPETLDEAIDWVIQNVEGIEIPLKREKEESFIAQSHMSYGQWIRNNWGFWEEKGNLYFWFLSLGINHADDMSGIIITSTYRRFHGEDIELDKQVQHYKDFWKNNS